MSAKPPRARGILSVMFALLLSACASAGPATAPAASGLDPKAPAAIPAPGPGQEVAVFAGGCFWCLESDFDTMPGVVHTTSGYAGGRVVDPTYEQVVTETTGHREAVRVVYDTAKVDYAGVLDWFWRHVDPTDAGGQFCDRGESYSTAVFPVDAAQAQAALASKKQVEATLGQPVATLLMPGQRFYAAENYHQDFHETNPLRYRPYRMGCGRDARVAEVWKGRL